MSQADAHCSCNTEPPPPQSRFNLSRLSTKFSQQIKSLVRDFSGRYILKSYPSCSNCTSCKDNTKQISCKSNHKSGTSCASCSTDGHSTLGTQSWWPTARRMATGLAGGLAIAAIGSYMYPTYASSYVYNTAQSLSSQAISGIGSAAYSVTSNSWVPSFRTVLTTGALITGASAAGMWWIERADTVKEAWSTAKMVWTLAGYADKKVTKFKDNPIVSLFRTKALEKEEKRRLEIENHIVGHPWRFVKSLASTVRSAATGTDNVTSHHSKSCRRRC